MSIRNVINKQISAQTNGLLTRGQYGATVVALQEGRNNSSWPADLGVAGAALTISAPTAGGSGYTTATCVPTTSAAGGTGLTVNITANGAGMVTAITICDPGMGYAGDATVITIAQNGSDSMATFTVTTVSLADSYRLIDLSGGTASELDTALAFQTQPAIQVRLPPGSVAGNGASTNRQLLIIKFPTENQGFPWPFTAQDYFETNLAATVNGGEMDAGTSPLGVCAAEIIRPADANSSGEIVFRRINIPPSNVAAPSGALIDCILEARLRKLNVQLITGNNDLSDATDDVAA